MPPLAPSEPGTDSETTSDAIVHMKDIQKQFAGKIALNSAELFLHRQEILGLVGDNGAGKSTLLKILSGVLRRDAGKIIIGGKPVRIDAPTHSRDLGIEMVYQDLSLCESLSVWENAYLGRYETRKLLKPLVSILDKRKMARQAAHVLTELGITLTDINTPVRHLSGGQRQAVAICRCLLFQPRIVLLDEPTASMAAWEQKKILDLIRSLKDRGKSVIMVTHNLRELFQVADRAAVLKEGRTIWQGILKDTTPDELARMMFLGKA